MNFPQAGWPNPNTGVPFMNSANTLRPRVQPYSKAIGAVLTKELQDTQNISPMRRVLYQSCSQSQFANQLFIEMFAFAAMLAEYYMACNASDEIAVTNASMATVRYYAATMLQNCQGQVTQEQYQQANALINEFNQMRAAVQTFIANNPVANVQQMMQGMPTQQQWGGGMGAMSNVDPRLGGNQFAGGGFAMPMVPGMQPQNFALTGMPGMQTQNPLGFQGGAMNATQQVNPMVLASQTPVKTTEGTLLAKKKQEEQMAMPITPVVDRKPIVMAELGTVKLNPMAKLVDIPSPTTGSTVLGSVTMPVDNATVSVVGQEVILYSDANYEPEKRYLGYGVHPVVIDTTMSVGYVDLNTGSYGAHFEQEPDVEYLKHRNFHLLQPRNKRASDPDNTDYMEAVRNAAMVADIKTTLERLETDRNDVNLAEEAVMDYSAIVNVHLGLVPVTDKQYHVSALGVARDSGLNIDIDIDNSVIRMTAMTSTDWCLSSAHKPFIDAITKSTRWLDISNKLMEMKARMPAHIWYEIDNYLMRVYNEINMIELDSGVFINDSFCESLLEAGKDISNNLGEDCRYYLGDALTRFKDRILFDNGMLLDPTVDKDNPAYSLTTLEDVTLLPIDSSQIYLACPDRVGTVTQSATPELYGLIDLTYKSKRPNVRYTKIITRDSGTLYIFKSLINDAYLLTATVDFN